MTKKKLDFVVVCLILASAAILSLVFYLKPLIGGVLYVIAPAIYLCLREKKNYKKILLGTLVLGVFMGFFFEFIQAYNGGWYIPVDRLTIPWKVFGIAPIDDILAFVIMPFFTLVFYEHFIDDEKNKRLSGDFWELFVLTLVGVLFVIFAYLLNLGIIKTSYVYFKGGLLATIFPIYYLFRNPRIVYKVAAITIFSIFVWFVAEIVGVKINGWAYAGQYIGWFNIGSIRFPIEEVIFWMLFYGAVIVAFYERFIDDNN